MKQTILITFAFVILVFAADTAFACSCLMEPNKPEVNYSAWAKDFKGAAFSGRVTKVEKVASGMELKVTFAVKTNWRRADSPEITIYTAENSAMCGVTFEQGKDYTVISDSEGEKLSVFSCSEMEYARHRDKYLSALGAAEIVGNAPKKFDEFGNINCGDELARLDNLALHLQNDPESIAFIIVYGGKTGKKNEATARLARMKHYMSKNRGVDASRVITIDGGYRDTLSGELWTGKRTEYIPIGIPEPTPTVAAKSVKLKGTAKIREYNCGDEMGK